MLKKVKIHQLASSVFVLIMAILLVGAAQAQPYRSGPNQAEPTSSGTGYLLTFPHHSQACNTAYNDFLKAVGKAGLQDLNSTSWACSENGRISYVIFTAGSEWEAKNIAFNLRRNGVPVSLSKGFQTPAESFESSPLRQRDPGLSGPFTFDPTAFGTIGTGLGGPTTLDGTVKRVGRLATLDGTVRPNSGPMTFGVTGTGLGGPGTLSDLGGSSSGPITFDQLNLVPGLGGPTTLSRVGTGPGDPAATRTLGTGMSGPTTLSNDGN